MSDKETRVGLYSGLRDKIEKMDTLSFDDPDRDSKYGLNGNSSNVVHEESMSSRQLEDQHIKKNTLSISIDDLIKQNDDYTMALEKKEIDKRYKSVKKRQKEKLSKKNLIILVSSCVAFVLLAVIIFVGLHLGGII